MAQKMYPRGGTNEASCHRGVNSNDAAGGARGWDPLMLATTPGAVLAGGTRSTVLGPTSLEIWFGTPVAIEWLSDPLSADFTISGTITFNLWAFESAMAANVGVRVIVERMDSTGAIASTISNSAKGTELGTSPAAVQNWTATPTSTSMLRGDRLRVRMLGTDAGGTMAAGNSFSINWAGPTAAADGDTWIQFTENLTFESTSSDPGGSQIFFTDTASSVVTASVDREAWTSRGSGVVNDVTNTVAGPTSPIQITDTAGGTVVDWFTKPLTAFTLGGITKFNVRANESAAGANCSIRAEIAIVAGDGTGAVVWGAACCDPRQPASESSGELPTSQDFMTLWVAGDDTSVTNGQRLRLRIYIDDLSDSAMATGFTVTVYYAGTSAGASGDTYVLLSQSVSEFVAGSVIDKERVYLDAVRHSNVW